MQPPAVDESANLCAPIESLLADIPLCASPLGRTVVFASLGGAAAFYFKPSMSFNADGSTRPFILFDSSNANAAIFPWWAWIVVPGVVFGVFI